VPNLFFSAGLSCVSCLVDSRLVALIFVWCHSRVAHLARSRFPSQVLLGGSVSILRSLIFVAAAGFDFLA
jgi:hypothetical protein